MADGIYQLITHTDWLSDTSCEMSITQTTCKTSEKSAVDFVAAVTSKMNHFCNRKTHILFFLCDQINIFIVFLLLLLNSYHSDCCCCCCRCWCLCFVVLRFLFALCINFIFISGNCILIPMTIIHLPYQTDRLTGGWTGEGLHAWIRDSHQKHSPVYCCWVVSRVGFLLYLKLIYYMYLFYPSQNKQKNVYTKHTKK